MKFAEMTAPAIGRIDKARTVVIAPIAAIEQHSRHLPVVTDTVLVTAVAEGVETAEQWSFLLARQCDLFQGYYLGRPVDAGRFAREFLGGAAAAG